MNCVEPNTEKNTGTAADGPSRSNTPRMTDSARSVQQNELSECYHTRDKHSANSREIHLQWLARWARRMHWKPEKFLLADAAEAERLATLSP